MEDKRVHLISEISNDICEQVIQDEVLEVVKACFQCGTCSGSCPSGRRTALKTRKIIREALLGLEAVLSSDDIWLCSTCYTCYERCPRSIPVTDVIIKLRNLASQKGYMKPPHIAVTHILANTGHGVPLGIIKGEEDNKWSEARAKIGLSNIPPTTHAHPECLEEVQTLLKEMQFDKLIHWDQNKNDELKKSQKKAKSENPESESNKK